MRLEEFMIGDWVMQICVGEERFNHPIKIGLHELIRVQAALSNSDDRLDVKPIPLTPEILEKNGFHINGIPNSITSVKAIDDWSDDTYVWSRQETPDERMFVSVYMYTSADFFVEVYCQYCHADGIHVKYLHELQHALKLCGIEKNIII